MAVIFAGSFVQSAIGFGLAIVAAPILFQISPEYVPAPICVVGFFVSVLNTLKYRQNISVGGLKAALIWRVPGSILGGGLISLVSASVLSLWLGILVLISLGISLLPFKLEPTPKRMAFAGLLSGFMGTSSGIGGPPMALLLQHQEANTLRANLSAFFLFSSVISIVVLVVMGHFTLHQLYISLPLLPSTWLGYKAARACVDKLSKEWIRRFALTLCLISGSSAIIDGLI
ncbi:sulfite exporter TauE/SafE family protein [Vibrio sp. JC009]|uniref:sulfite exporter TauE/SafE family protein n=1 Tax=Vibrio sp. JC009 TaxID=2912314 RepID=UPI0023AF5005|nr:sulfite exporter TauE/SafE family protein [Vibrio sp. JC009]WED23295.1 sulfite exporter TauE/SafE family protein [Vibrio sp. JC009]